MANPLPSLNLSSQLTPLFAYLQKQKDNRRFRQTVEIAGTFLLISFFLLFAIRPTVNTISNLIGEIKSKELLTSQMRQKIADVITAQDLFSQVQERYSLVESCLPSYPRFSQAKAQIDTLATLNQINPDKLTFVLNPDSSFSVSLSTPSSFASGLGLLTSFLHNRRLIDIPSVSFTVDKDLAASRQIYLSLPLKFYYEKN